MSGVDDRVVSMTFDNALFERKMADTIKSLDKLRTSLDFANSKRGMDELSASARGFNLGGMVGALEGVSGKFLALTTIGVTAMATLATKAISVGAQFLSSFTIDPITDGFREFETNMNSIQTILANTDSKGTTLQQVNDALDQLNQYSDQTIYNFSEMARNIGTFTAAGVDLDTSVSAIKGIANLAAISGSNSEQASTAMYQLSQAIASGTVKLMDWNSVVNAGMGGEVFQKALFESGKAMGTLADVPMTQSFEQWTDAGNSFRGSLEQGWLTGEVLTNTLQTFTGDLTEAQIMSMGYTQEQAAELARLGQLGKAAATQVKTFTQLLGTVKESVASGWSASFRILIGDFNESKELFTSINTAIGNMVSESADARNELLQGWKDLGGRTVLIEGFKSALQAVNFALGPIVQAFRDIFPPMTAQRLFEMTQRFAEFTENLKIGEETAAKVKRAFSGFFAALEIGWEIVKGVIRVIGDLIGSLSGVGSGALDFAANTGDALVTLNEALVAGGGIRDFFERISGYIQNAVEFVKNFKDSVVDLFLAFTGSDAVADSVERVGNRFEGLAGSAGRIGAAIEWLSERFSGIADVLDQVWQHLSTWFSELGAKLATAFGPGDFDAAVDIVNVGLLGGIAVLLRKFLSGGINLDFGNGLIEKITETFDGLTGALKAMQADLKARALLKIAAAVAILTASVGVLAMIDSAALAKALTALTVGFGQLIGAMMLLDKIDFGTSVIKLNGLAAGMILLATAAAVLSIAIKNLSDLGWEELAKGLAGVGVSLGLLVAATNLIASDTGGMVRAGVAMIAMSVAILVLAEAVEAFAEMSWGEMARGLTGVAVGLGLITAAMNFMPPNMLLTGVGVVAVAAGMRILAEAVSAFAEMSWGDMARGLTGVGVGLALIAGIMSYMPPSLPITAAGLLILSVALNVMAEAVEAFSEMDWGELARGIGAIAALLLVLVVAMNAMTGALGGAAALVVVSAALVILTHVLIELSQLSLGELAMGLGAIAATLAVLGLAAMLLGPVIPLMLALGVAIALLGAGFALFGAGAYLVARAFEAMANAGRAGADAIIDVVRRMIDAFPELVGAFVRALTEIANEILVAAPVLLENVKILLSHILETVIELTPQIAEAIAAIITAAVILIRNKAPEIIRLGFEIIMHLLRGLRDNIGQITTVAIEILSNFAEALAADMQKIVDAAILIIFSFLDAISQRAGDIAEAGVQVLLAFLVGITEQVSRILDTATFIITTLLSEIAGSISRIISAGYDILLAFLKGIADNIADVVTGVTQIITTFIDTMVDNASNFIESGLKVLTDFLQGILDNLADVVDTVADMVSTFVTAMVNNASKLVKSGWDALLDFLDGILNNLIDVTNAVASMVTRFVSAMANNASKLVTAGWDALLDFLDGILDNLVDVVNAVGDMISTFVTAVTDNASKLISAGLDALTDFLKGILDNLIDITNTVGDMVTTFITAVGDKAVDIANAGTDALVDFLTGIGENLLKVTYVVGAVIGEFIESVGDKAGELTTAGTDALIDFIEGIGANLLRAVAAGVDTAIAFINGIAAQALELARAGADALIDFLNGLAAAIREKDDQIREAGANVAEAIVEGIIGGLGSSRAIRRVIDKALSLASSALNAVRGFLGMDSPSKEFIKIGKFAVEGFAIGLSDSSPVKDKAIRLADDVITSVRDSLSHIPDSLADMDEFNPVITPVLDLTRVQAASRSIDGLIAISAIVPEVSYERARLISTTTDLENRGSETPAYNGPSEIKFEQNIFAPEALSTNDIYRNTKSQIALAKEELSI